MLSTIASKIGGLLWKTVSLEVLGFAWYDQCHRDRMSQRHLAIATFRRCDKTS